MQFNLFSQNLVTILAMISTALGVYFAALPWLRAEKKLPDKKNKRTPAFVLPRKKLAALVAGALALSGGVQLAATLLFPGEQLPLLFLMALPLGVAIALVVWAWKFWQRWFEYALGGVLVLSTLLFGAAMLNDYYHYYPTLNDAFNLTKHQKIGNVAGQTVVRYSSSKVTARATLEESLQNIGTLPATGQVYRLDVPATVSRFATRPGWLYVPPVAFSPEKINLPVIILLAGAPGGPNDWLNGGGAEQTLNAFAAEHHGVAPIVAIVDDLGSQLNDTECVDSAHGNAETYLTVDVPNYLKANFDVSANPANWAIGGLSDGGMCGVMLTLRHPNVFHYFLDLGGGSGPNVGSQIATVAQLFHGSQREFEQHEPLYLLQHNSFKSSGLGGYFAVGNSDSTEIVNAVETLYHQSAAGGLDVAAETTQGRHTFAVWQQQFHDALPWLSYHLGATTCPDQCY